MKLGIVLSSNHAETNWNALRLANLALEKGDEVKIFLIGEGVEYEKPSSEKFNITEQIQKTIKYKTAEILACGTCLKLRNQQGTDTCPLSTLKDFYRVVEWSDKLLTF
jgi:sulfur relay (sulfurtransferase) complex TusBCD TusD component (DsrE family)